MKLLCWTFIVAGVMSICFGLASCRHYYAVNPPPEAYQPGWDAEAHAKPYVALQKIFSAVAGGVIAILLGLYLRGRAQSLQSAEDLNELLTMMTARFCPKCGRPQLRVSEVERQNQFGLISRVRCSDCGIYVERSGAIIVVSGWILLVGAFFAFGFVQGPDLLIGATLISIPFGIVLSVVGFMRLERQFKNLKRYVSAQKRTTSAS